MHRCYATLFRLTCNKAALRSKGQDNGRQKRPDVPCWSIGSRGLYRLGLCLMPQTREPAMATKKQAKSPHPVKRVAPKRSTKPAEKTTRAAKKSAKKAGIKQSTARKTAVARKAPAKRRPAVTQTLKKAATGQVPKTSSARQGAARAPKATASER